MVHRESRHTPEFRAEASKPARTRGKPPTVIARELGMSVKPSASAARWARSAIAR